MSKEAIRSIQSGLEAMGYAVGPLDGLWGPKTQSAITGLLAASGRPVAPSGPLPWMIEAEKVKGWHETRNNAALKAWLKSDGATLGDPAKLPWCGDFVATAIRRALPSEPFPGNLGVNPYWAKNWSMLGRATAPTYGAVMVFTRDGGGHVGFCVGEDATAFHILGGNQSNAVTVSRIEKKRLISARWPATYAQGPIDLPRLDASGKVSTNEA